MGRGGDRRPRLAEVLSLRWDAGQLVASGVSGTDEEYAYLPVEWRRGDRGWERMATGSEVSCRSGPTIAGAVVSTGCGHWLLSAARPGEAPVEAVWNTDLTVATVTPPVSVGPVAVTIADGSRRADAAFCFDDATTCRQSDSALLATVDGFRWFEVDLGGPARPVAVLQQRDELIVLATSGRSVDVAYVIDLASGSLPQRAVTDVPELSLPLFDGRLDLDERRFASVLSGCRPTALTINGRRFEITRWEVVEPFPDWVPARQLGILDGPSAEIDAVLHMVGLDEVRLETVDRRLIGTFTAQRELADVPCVSS